MTETNQFLRDYAHDASEAAFRSIVTSYIDLVYSVALRRVDGDAHLAQDIVQTVFVDLARKARSLPSDVMLGGWLHRHTCFVASTMRRGEQRRQTREREAVEMNTLHESSDQVWKQMGPVLDEAINELDGAERHAILLRFFEQRDLRSVGVALGVSEDAAQKRVTRAVEKLRELLGRSGAALTGAGLASALSASAVSAAPVGLASSISATALATVAGAGGAGGLLNLLASAKLKLGLAAGIVAVVAIPLFLRQVDARHNGAKNSDPPPAAVAPKVLATPADSLSSVTTAGKNTTSNKAALESGSLKLTMVAADSGKPVPIVQIDYRRWEGDKFTGRTLHANRFGVCDVTFPAETTTDLELTTRIDDFADTRLHWRMERGELIPANYTLRLTRPVPIGGKVVDADGQPVAGAKVGWNHKSEPESETRPESHEFGWIEVKTDAEGRWRINRIAPEMIRRLYGSAKHPEHVDTWFATHDHEAEKQLLAEQHLFQLGRAVSIRGVVFDTERQPVNGAKILLGQHRMSDRRETKSADDGTFHLPGCKLGQNLLSAEAKGFAATTIEVDVTADSEPFQLTLQHGKVLRLRVVNQAGQPVPKASVWLNTIDSRFNQGQPSSPAVQANFNPRTDADGKVVWPNAPAAELSFDVHASGYMRVDGVKIPADGEEHVIKLPPALVVSGTVRDEATGELVPRFRIVTGWPSLNLDGTTGAQWSTIDRFWISFVGGKFRHSYEEGVIGGTKNPGYVLKFEAEGYAPFVSRVIGADEGEVRLDVTLTAASMTTVTVLLADGSPAADVDVGLVSPGARLTLRPGGFSRQNVQSGGSLRTTDGTGKFQLPPDETIGRIIVACSSGYAEASRVLLAENPIMQLQPWGCIEGTYLSGGQPVADREFLLQHGAAGTSGVSFDFSSFKVSTDKEGRFVFPQVPPGTFKLVRMVPQKMSEGRGSWSHAPLQDVEVRPGETTTVTVGGSGYTVTAHMRWPADLKPDSGWHIFASINTPLPPSLAEMRKNPEAAAKWQQMPEFQEFSQNARHFTVAIGGDWTLTAENVPPGEYELTVMAILGLNGGEKAKASANGVVKLTVPAEPANGSLDAGEVILRKAENPQ